MRDVGKDILLIAGGVGINPLYSIINHLADLCTKGDNPDMFHDTRVVLLYSARTEDELIFMVNLFKVFLCSLDMYSPEMICIKGDNNLICTLQAQMRVVMLICFNLCLKHV